VPTDRGIATSSSAHLGFGSHTSENDPEVLQREKERNLRGEAPTIHPDMPGWNPNLASDSEAVVKAEQMGDMAIEDMQQQTVRVVEELRSTVDVHVTNDSGPISAGSGGSRGNAAPGGSAAQGSGPHKPAEYPGSASSGAS
jgi:hypothetical protein